MSLIEHFLKQINEDIIGFDKSVDFYNRLTRLQEKVKKEATFTRPVYDLGDGRQEEIDLSDSSAMHIYHRIHEEIETSEDQDDGFGMKTLKMYQIPMKMVIIGYYDRFKEARSDYGEVLAMHLANRLRGNYNADFADIDSFYLSVEEIQTDKIQILEEEFVNYEAMKAKAPTLFISSVDYEIMVRTCEDLICV